MSVVLFAWPQDGIVETLSWLTDIITAWAGDEQRIKIRLCPRRSLKMTFWPTSAKVAQRLENMTQAGRSDFWYVPLFPEASRLTATPVDGAYTVSVDTSNMTLVAGDLAMLWASDDKSQTLTVQSVAAASIGFTEPVAMGADHSGPTFAIPVHKARLAEQPSKERAPGVQDKLTFTFILDEDRDVSDALSLPQYLGLDVFVYPSRFLQSESQTVEYTKFTSEIDYSTGKTFYTSPVAFTSQQLQVEVRAVDRASAFAIRQFYARRMGRLVPFWYPLYDVDMTPAVNIGANDTTITVEHRYFSLLSGHVTRQHLFIETTDGTQYYRSIASIVENGGYEAIAIDSALGATLLTSQIKIMCFLGLFRLDQDDAEMTWSTSPTLKSSMTIKDVMA